MQGGGIASCTLPLGSDGPEIECIAYPMPRRQSVSQVAFEFPKLQQFLTKWFLKDSKNCGEIQMQLLKYFDPITGYRTRVIGKKRNLKTPPRTYTRAI